MRVDDLAALFDRFLPDALDPVLARILGDTIPRRAGNVRYLVTATGRFSGDLVSDVMNQAHNRRFDGALLVAEKDVTRVVYFRRGRVVGADSNVLFDRLGRILGGEGVIGPEDVDSIVEEEETRGLASAVARLTEEAVEWGLDRRIREITSNLYFMPRSHFVLVKGKPDLGDIPLFDFSPIELAMEGLRRYDEWRNRSKTASS
jgi:hypothetical protein